MAGSEKRIIEGNRSSMAQSIRPLTDQLTTLIAMLDQFALSVLIHMPEIPEGQRKQAIAAGERRHHGWRAEVEDMLVQGQKTPAHRNGDQA